MKSICNAIGSCHLCKGCGAAKLHYNTSCEPCPIVKHAKCLPIKETFQFRQNFEDFLEEKIWRFFHVKRVGKNLVVSLDGVGSMWMPMVLELLKETGHQTLKVFFDHARTELKDMSDFYLVHTVEASRMKTYNILHKK